MKKKLVVFLVAFFAIFAMPHNAKAAMAILDLNQEFELTSASKTDSLNRFKCYLSKQSTEQAYQLEITGATEGEIEKVSCSQLGGAMDELPLDLKWEDGKAYATTPVTLEAGNMYMFYIKDDADDSIKVKISATQAPQLKEFSGTVNGRQEAGSSQSTWYKTKIETAGEYILIQNPNYGYGIVLRDSHRAVVKVKGGTYDEIKGEKRTLYDLEPGECYIQVYPLSDQRAMDYTLSLVTKNTPITAITDVEIKNIDNIQMKTGRNIHFKSIPDYSNDTVDFESSDPTIAKIISGTELYFLKEGQVQLTAKNGKGDVLGTWVLTIKGNSATFKEGKLISSSNDTNNTTKPTAVKVTKIKINGQSNTIANGKSIQLSAKVTPSNATNKKVTWTSSNKKYATVSANGKVTTKKAGKGKTVTITAKANDGSNVKATYKIKIAKGVVKKVKISGKKTVKAGKTLKLKAKVTASKGAYKKVVWTSSNKKYATVSASGKVKALKAGKKKTVTITA